MSDRPLKIMVVEPQPSMVEMLVGALSGRFNAQITCVVDAGSCMDVELLEPHDLIIVDRDLKEADGLELVEQLVALSARPVILLAEKVTCEEAIAALRMGVRDLYVKPFGMDEFLDGCGRVLYGFEVRRRHQARYRKLRELVRHVIRDRRELNRRIDLVCRDLVLAHRRLLHRFVELDTARHK